MYVCMCLRPRVMKDDDGSGWLIFSSILSSRRWIGLSSTRGIKPNFGERW